MAEASNKYEDGIFVPINSEEIAINKSNIERKLKEVRHTLDTNSAKRIVDPVRRSKIEKEMKELESRFIDNVETWSDLRAFKPQSYEYVKARDKAQNRHKYEKYISEWKERAKMLEPDDPNYCSLDRLRREK